MALILKNIPNSALLQEPKAATPTISKDPMYKAIDAYAVAAAKNADIDAAIKALTASKIDMEPLYEKVMTEISPHYATELALKDKEFTVESKKNKLKVGKMGTKRVITDMLYVFNKLKKGPFLEACTLPLTALDNYLTNDEKKECVTSSDTKRNVTLVGPAEAKKK